MLDYRNFALGDFERLALQESMVVALLLSLSLLWLWIDELLSLLSIRGSPGSLCVSMEPCFVVSPAPASAFSFPGV